MQLAMNASPAPRRCGSVAFCNCSKQKYSISLGAAEAEVTLTNGKRTVPTSMHFGFIPLCSSAVVVGLFT
jgi:hypothetical protein